MRAIVDTNVLLSGLIWKGAPHRLLELIRTGGLGLVSSRELIDELAGVIERPKFLAAIASSQVSPERMLSEIRFLAELVDAPPLAMPISRDPDDDAVLALAAAARPDLIITGDRDLLTVERHQGIRIVTPVAALALLPG